MFRRNRVDEVMMSEEASRLAERSRKAGAAAHTILGMLMTPEVAERIRGARSLELENDFRVSIARPIDTAELQGTAVATWHYEDPYLNPEAHVGVQEHVEVLGVVAGRVVRAEWGWGYSRQSKRASEDNVETLQLAVDALRSTRE